MSTSSDTTRAIDRKQSNGLLLVLVVLTLALATGCSMSLVDKAPEILRHCRIVDVSDAPAAVEVVEQAPGPSGNAASDDCAGGRDRVCEDDEIADAIARGDAVNCTS
jgi:hypothetical protein